MSPKYKQRGYMEGEKKQPARLRKPRPSGDSLRPAPEPLKARDYFKCTACGAQQSFEDDVPFTKKCDSCGADLHSCFNCRFFDPSSPNECTQPIEVAIAAKRAANKCPLFKPKITVTLTADSTSKPIDARKAFDDLFKKI